jgi:hypothetical protein
MSTLYSPPSGTSAALQSADAIRRDHHFRVVPNPDLSRCSKAGALFNHSVGAHEQGGRNFEG